MEPTDWITVVGIAVPGILGALGLIAEKTPFDWDNKVVSIIRKIWSWIPIGERNPDMMGSVKDRER